MTTITLTSTDKKIDLMLEIARAMGVKSELVDEEIGMPGMITWHSRCFKDLTASELYSILRLRQEVFAVEQNCVYLDADGKDLKSEHLMGYVGEELAVYSRLVPAGVSYDKEVSIGRVVSAINFRGKGYGLLLMHASIRQVQRLYGLVDIRISAQLYLQKFYESFGFVREGEPYMEDEILHIAMLRKGTYPL